MSSESEQGVLKEAEAARINALAERDKNANILEANPSGLVPTANFILRLFAPKDRTQRRRERNRGKKNN